MDKCNGLSSSTKFYSRQEGQHTIQYHEHPETHELVVMDTWYVQSGEDDVDHEFEVIGVYSPDICKTSKMIEALKEKITTLIDNEAENFINDLTKDPEFELRDQILSKESGMN